MIRKKPVLAFGWGLTIVFLVLGIWRVTVLEMLDTAAYDFMMRLRAQPQSASNIVMVDIDNSSLEKLGRWPWSRSLIAKGVQKINQGEPRVVGLNLLLSEAEKSDGLEILAALEELFNQSLLKQSGKPGEVYLKALNAAQQQLQHDLKLSQVLKKAGNIVIPALLKPSSSENISLTRPAEGIQAFSVNLNQPAKRSRIPRAAEIVLPLPQYLDAVRGIGHFNLDYDPDGAARREALVINYRGLMIPSYTLMLAAQYLDVPVRQIEFKEGVSVAVGNHVVPTSREGAMFVNFKGSRGSFQRYPFVDLLEDKIAADVFRDKLVLISPSGAGIMNPLRTSTDPTMPVGEYSAHVIWSILNQRFVDRPGWGQFVELILILGIGLMVAYIIPRLRALYAASTFILLMTALAGVTIYLFVSRGIWIKTAYPLMEWVIGYIGVVSLSYVAAEASKDRVEGESAENNRMLGLSFQSQGMLDMAFDKFRRVPVQGDMKEILYNLALDFERKRQLNKAVAVYEHIAEHDREFKDIQQRKDKLIRASDTLVFGEGELSPGAAETQLLATATDTPPTLGRYEIIRPLGKGAMGVVYLGLDPRINRKTAIKTFRFSQELQSEAIAELKEKFFREAESAGALSHPNIVTVYDAGEEQDLAFIAMEFLEGETFETFIRKGHLLPVRRVIDYAATIAQALDYAHKEGIIHRDIKPANIMLLKQGEVKIMDFGIAHVAANSQTQTGVVKGTPYYMSPEQFSGKKVDGRSDIFSLGTMLFQMLTGRPPFFADNPLTLMHKIMKTPHPDPRTLNPKIPKALVKIMDRCLAKDRRQRYQRAAQLGRHLDEIGRKIDALRAQHVSNPVSSRKAARKVAGADT